MPFLFKAPPAILAVGFAALTLQAQVAPQPNPSPTSQVTALLSPALADVQGTTAAISVSKWKASRDVRQAAQADVNSIQRDIGSTLPALMAQADTTPGSIPPAFAVYRNLDALYDVLLRVSQTADLAGSSREAAALASSLKRLEAARSALGDTILNTSRSHEEKIVSLEAAIRTARTAPGREKKETVIDDGPVKHQTTRRAGRRTVHHKETEHKASQTTTTHSGSSGK